MAKCFRNDALGTGSDFCANRVYHNWEKTTHYRFQGCFHRNNSFPKNDLLETIKRERRTCLPIDTPLPQGLELHNRIDTPMQV